MNREFFLKSLSAIVKTIDPKELPEFVRQVVYALYEEAELESMDRYRIILEGVKLEVERELRILSAPSDDISIDLGSQVGTERLEGLLESLSETIDMATYED